MAPIDLNLLRSFFAVYETGSFSAGAARLGVPRSTVSRAVSALESELSLELFQRTTRQVTRTAEARTLYERVSGPVSALETALSEGAATDAEPTGTLRVTTTADLGVSVLAEAATRFTARYPQVRIEVHLSNAAVDLVRDGFDLALRVALGPLRNSSLVARKVGVVRLQLYASPTYLARHGSPKRPDSLAEHQWVAFRGQPRLRLPPARIQSDDMFFLREVARLDGGIAMLPTFVADPDVAAGTLVRVLPNWATTTGTVHLVHPARKNVPSRVSAFEQLLLELLRRRPLD